MASRTARSQSFLLEESEKQNQDECDQLSLPIVLSELRHDLLGVGAPLAWTSALPRDSLTLAQSQHSSALSQWRLRERMKTAAGG